MLPISTVVPPNAGLSTNMSVCSNLPSFSMIGELDGSPQFGGAWIGPNGDPQPNFFTPGVSPSGCYTYNVAGSAPCTSETAVLCITVINAPNAGTSGSLTVCSTDPPVSMISYLGGSPDPGGFWSGPQAPNGGMFDPAIMGAGQYSYHVVGIAPCPTAFSYLVVMEYAAPDAGTNATVSRCLSQGDVDLFAQLGGNPELGGTWTDTDATGQLTGSTFAVSGMPSGSYSFTYTVAGGNCPDAQATVTVNLNAMCIMTPHAPYPVE